MWGRARVTKLPCPCGLGKPFGLIPASCSSIPLHFRLQCVQVGLYPLQLICPCLLSRGDTGAIHQQCWPPPPRPEGHHATHFDQSDCLLAVPVVFCTSGATRRPSNTPAGPGHLLLTSANISPRHTVLFHDDFPNCLTSDTTTTLSCMQPSQKCSV